MKMAFGPIIIDDVWAGVQESYRQLKAEVQETYGVTLTTIGAIGFSAMMYGNLAFDKDANLLTPFRTWRNTMTEPAAKELTELFRFNIPPALAHCTLHKILTQYICRA